MINQDQISDIKKRLGELKAELADPAVFASAKASVLVNEQRDLKHKLDLFEAYLNTEKAIKSAHEMSDDPELGVLAKEELPKLEAKKTDLEQQIRVSLVPKDPNDTKNAILEIRAGAGGDESSLFAGELARMYARYGEAHGLTVDFLSSSPSEVGGYKEAIFEVTGPSAYGELKYESGVHRVQRVPQTESAGRIHTSTVTVAVLPEAEETDIGINTNDLKIDVFRSSGPGGQSVNTTDSAVRITHLPTGIVVTCQDEKSQLKNKTKALSVLRSRLLVDQQEKESRQRGEARVSQIGTGDRSEKIRTYNFPQDRVTDHRINYTTRNLAGFMDGQIDNLVTALKEADIEKALANSSSDS